MKISISPYTFFNLNTKLKFETRHTLKKQVTPDDFPHVNTPTDPKFIQSFLNRIILRIKKPNENFFIRSQGNVNRQEIRDLSQMRTKNYQSFDTFLDDIKSILKSGIAHENQRIRAEANELTSFVYNVLVKLVSKPNESPFPKEAANENEIQKNVEQKINKIRANQRKNSTQESGKKHSKKIEQIQATEINEIIKKIRNNLSRSPALMGIIELLEGKPFSPDMLPYELSIKKLQSKKIDWDSFKKYLNYCIESNNNKIYVAPNPRLPEDLQQIQSKYEMELANWLNPPKLDSV